MKQLYCLLKVIILLGMLSSCGGGKSNDPTPVTPITPPVIVVTPPVTAPTVIYTVLYSSGNSVSIDANGQITNGSFNTIDPVTKKTGSINLTIGGSIKGQIRKIPEGAIKSEDVGSYSKNYYPANVYKLGDTPPSVATLAQDSLSHTRFELKLDDNNVTILFLYNDNTPAAGGLHIISPNKNAVALDVPTLTKVYANNTLKIN